MFACGLCVCWCHLLGSCRGSVWSRWDMFSRRGWGDKIRRLVWLNPWTVNELVCSSCDRRQVFGGFSRGHQCQREARDSSRFALLPFLLVAFRLLLGLFGSWLLASFVLPFLLSVLLCFPCSCPFFICGLLFLLTTLEGYFSPLWCDWILSRHKLAPCPPLFSGGGWRWGWRIRTVLPVFPLFDGFWFFRKYCTQEALCCCPRQHIMHCFHLSRVCLKSRGSLRCNVKIQHIK